MKKTVLFLTLLLILFGLSACSQKDETQEDSNETPNVTENEENEEPGVTENEENEEPSVTENADKENEAPSINEEPPHEPEEEKQYENDSFKEVVITENNEEVIVKGKARVFEGVFQYAIVSGTNRLLEEHYQTDGAPAWSDFELTFDKKLITESETSLELFVYSAKDGSKTSVLTIPLTTK
jgi:hypothetical protein